MKVVIAHGIDLCEPYLDNRVALEAEAIMEEGHEITVVCWARTVSGETVEGPEEEVVNGVNVRRVFSPASTPDKPLPKRIFEHLLAKQRISKIIKLRVFRGPLQGGAYRPQSEDRRGSTYFTAPGDGVQTV